MMTSKEKSQLIIEYFNSLFPVATCALTYTRDYELLIAVMLSAQTTDKSVNKVTDILFDKYNSLDALESASLEDIEEIIKPIGLYKNKAKNLKGIVHDLITRYNYVLPSERDELVTLPGVGRKTANVVRCEVFKLPEFPVDTHIARISKRLGLAKKDDDVYQVEMKLRKIFPEENYILLHHQFINFGRTQCKAISPNCEKCKLCLICHKETSKAK